MPGHIGQPCEFGRQLVIRELLERFGIWQLRDRKPDAVSGVE